jgi:hypothetical protein
MLREIGVSAAATVLSIVDVRQGNRMTFRTRRRSASALVGRPGLTLIVLSAWPDRSAAARARSNPVRLIG